MPSQVDFNQKIKIYSFYYLLKKKRDIFLENNFLAKVSTLRSFNSIVVARVYNYYGEVKFIPLVSFKLSLRAPPPQNGR